MSNYNNINHDDIVSLYILYNIWCSKKKDEEQPTIIEVIKKEDEYED